MALFCLLSLGFPLKFPFLLTFVVFPLCFSLDVKILADQFKTPLDVSVFSRAFVLPPVRVVSAAGRPEDEGGLPPL